MWAEFCESIILHQYLLGFPYMLGRSHDSLWMIYMFSTITIDPVDTFVQKVIGRSPCNTYRVTS